MSIDILHVTRAYQTSQVLVLTPKPGRQNESLYLIGGESRIYVSASEIEALQPIADGGTCLLMKSGRLIYVEEAIELFFYSIPTESEPTQ